MSNCVTDAYGTDGHAGHIWFVSKWVNNYSFTVAAKVCLNTMSYC